MKLSWLGNAYLRPLLGGLRILTTKVGQTDQFFRCRVYGDSICFANVTF